MILAISTSMVLLVSVLAFWIIITILVSSLLYARKSWPPREK
jgi:hypothetical protein